MLSLLVIWGSAEASYTQGLLGEQDGGTYAGPWRPEYQKDAYFGRLELTDDQFAQNFFFHYIWQDAPQMSRFLSSELSGASTCPNEVLAQQSNSLRYGYRLVVMSYLLEMLDGLKRDALLLKRADLCSFQLQEVLKSCRPQSDDMRAFVNGLNAQKPYSELTISQTHNYAQFERDWVQQVQKAGQATGSIRVHAQCRGEGKNCTTVNLADATALLRRACEQDKAFVRQICSEEDQVYGLADLPMVSQLLSTSNLMSLYNAEGYGPGCLRRYGQLMSAHERVPGHLQWSLPVARAELLKNYGERFPLGRAFVYGALKEFRDKGLADVFEPKVVEPAKPAPVVVEKPKPAPAPAPVVEKPVVVAEPKVVEAPKPKPPKQPEVEANPKSAFLLASEVRRSQQLDRVDVDMLKFRYDYVFNAAEMQLLSSTLKDYTTREALKEMQSYDKLGTNESPMPLTFLKYLIDSENHQGLYNVIAVLGENFWVSNDVDTKWKPAAEFVELRNDDSTARQWQLYVIRVD